MITIILLILILLVFFLYTKKSNYVKLHHTVNKSIDLIISRYNEDLLWTLEEPFNKYKYIVYNKGTNELFEKKNIKKIIKINNVGRCDHTYLYHIVNNYDNLADINIFLPGSLNLFYKKNKAETMLNKINELNKAVFISDYRSSNISKSFYNFQLDDYVSAEKKNITKHNQEKLKISYIRPYGKWYDNNFKNIVIKNSSFFGIFSIAKKDILQNDKLKYEKFMKDLENSSNPELGHYYERSWEGIFYPLNETVIINGSIILQFTLEITHYINSITNKL